MTEKEVSKKKKFMAKKSEKKSHKKSKKKDFVKSLSKNHWVISTIVLVVLLIGTLIQGNLSGAAIGASEAGQKVIDFAAKQGATAELIEVNSEGALYEVVVSIEGQEVPVYITKDGKSLVPQLVPLEDDGKEPASTTPAKTAPTPEVVKSDKPVVEAFVMSHCPYGTQIEKGLVPVMKLLGDKIDAEIKFVYYAMHPSQGEVEEQLNQYCIQEEQNDLFLDYLMCFLEAGDGEGCIDEMNIDKSQLATCVEATDKEFNVIANLEDQSSWLSGRFPKFDIHKAENDKYSVGGSPTLVINGAQVSVGRDSVALLDAVCAAFNDAPEECDFEFDAVTPSPGFGLSTTATANNAAAAATCG